MSQAKIKIGVLGCAKIARRSTIPAIRQLGDDFQLVAVASRSAEKAAAYAEEFACEGVVGYDALIARDDVDALYIPLPTGLHLEWIGKAIAAGKHVYAEKSFASTLAQSQELAAAAATAGTALMEGYMFLYHRQHALVRQILAEGQLGELRHFHGAFGFPPLPPDDFRYDEQVGGGVLMDAAGYPLCAALALCGDGLEVRAASVRRSPTRGNSQWGSAYLSDDRGFGASIAFGFDNLYQCRYEFWGSRGKLVAERAYTAGPAFSPRVTIETADGVRTIEVAPDNHFVGAVGEFRDIIRDPARRAAHRERILRQSAALERIRELSDPRTH